MVHLGLFGYLVQTFLLFASWISPSNHFLRDVLTHKHPKRCFMSYIQHDGQCCILSVSFMQTMRSGLKLTNQQFSIVSSDHRNRVKMSKCLVQSLQGYDVKRPYQYFTFYGEKELSELAILFFGIQFQKNMPIFDKLDMQKFIVIKFEKAWIQVLKGRVVNCRHGRSCLISSSSHIKVRVGKKSFW